MASRGHIDFELPGLTGNRGALTALIVSIVFAYSRRANIRRLEDHFHAFWNLALSYLIHGQPQLMLAPQMSVFFSNEEDLLLDPNVSWETVTGREAERRPDFTIMGVRLRNYEAGDRSTADNPMFPDVFRQWTAMMFETATPRAFLELKRLPSRNLGSAALFEEDLEELFWEASSSIHDQVTVAFERDDYTDMKSLILIIAVGEWWRFRILSRKEFEARKAKDAKDMLLNQFDEDEGEQGRKKKRAKKTRTRASGKLIPENGVWKRAPIKLYHNLDDVEPIHADAKHCKPQEGKFTKNILFGSSQSNQCFYFIHSLLKKLEPASTRLYASPGNSEDELGLKDGDAYP